MSKKEKMVKHCDYCGAKYKTLYSRARFCKASHRIAAFNRMRMQKLKELEAQQENAG